MNAVHIPQTQKIQLKDINAFRGSISEWSDKFAVKENDMQLVRKFASYNGMQKQKIDVDNRTVTKYVSMPTVDRDFDILLPHGVILDDFRKNPIVLWGHNYMELPVGRDEEIKFDGKGIIARTKYATKEANPLAEQVFQLQVEGVLNANSVGFLPTKWVLRDDDEKGNGDSDFERVLAEVRERYGISEMELRKARRIFTEWVLLEHSDVSVPSNPDALNLMAKKGIKIDNKLSEEIKSNIVQVDFDFSVDATVNSHFELPKEFWGKAIFVSEAKGETLHEFFIRQKNKGTVTFEAHIPVNVDRQWDGSAARRRLREWAGDDEVDYDMYRQGFAWYDSDNANILSSYKLPHHDIANGNVVTVFRGVTAAMAALLGARGGVDIPESDRRSVYNHLSRHYEQFERQPPEFRSYEAYEFYHIFGDDYLRMFLEVEQDFIASIKEATQRLRHIAAWYESDITNLTGDIQACKEVLGDTLTDLVNMLAIANRNDNLNLNDEKNKIQRKRREVIVKNLLLNPHVIIEADGFK